MTIGVHTFDSTGEAYDACQCREDIKTGDVLVIPSEGVVGIAWAWPFAVTTECGKLHSIEGDPLTFEPEKFGASIPVAMAEAAKLGKAPPADTITVTISGVDRSTSVRQFDSLPAAAAFAQRHVGKHPTLSIGYAISDDGVCEASVTGAVLAQLFPDPA